MKEVFNNCGKIRFAGWFEVLLAKVFGKKSICKDNGYTYHYIHWADRQYLVKIKKPAD